MSTRTYCDGCGCTLGVEQRPNWWHAAFMGDTIRNSNGEVMDVTGLTAPGNRQYVVRLLQTDLCIPCMSKTQGETT
jgi:hypothetical protein